MTERRLDYAQGLKKLINCNTVSVLEQTDKSKFYKFHELLEESFPTLFSVAQKEDFNGTLLLRWKGKSSIAPIMLMNHHDVVEVSGKWRFPPFSGEIKDGKVWGRGTLDTKGGLFCMLQAGEELAKDGFVPENDVYFFSSCNEEIDGSGAKEVCSILKERGVRLAFVLDEGGMIVQEPMSGAKGNFALIGVGEKSIATVKFIARSSGGHASTPPKNSPLVRLGKFMTEVENKKLFKVEMGSVVCKMFATIATGMKPPLRWILKNSRAFAPILKTVVPKISLTAGAMMKTTVAFTMAQGSDGDNVIPEEAFVVANVRCCHHQGEDESIAILQKLAKKHGLETQVTDKGIQTPLSDFNSKYFLTIERTIKEVYADVKTCPYVMTGASDCRFMSELSENCYRFTPFKIDLTQLESIHGIDENVDIECLDKAVNFYKLLIGKFQISD